MTLEKQNNNPNKPALSPNAEKSPVRIPPKKNALPYVLTFIIMFSVWIVLSGQFDSFHLTLGVISCSLVSMSVGTKLFPDLDIKKLPIVWFRFIRYVPWLLYQILLANIHLLYLAFHPKMLDLIDPQIIVFRSRLKSDLALLILANSITLTPGTVTLNVSIFEDITFHAIDVASGESVPGMDTRIAEIFDE